MKGQLPIKNDFLPSVKSRTNTVVGVALAALVALMAGAPDAHARQLSRPYTNPAYLMKLSFGLRSDYLQPWRAFLKTVPSHVFLDAVGVGLNLAGESPDLVCHMLAKNGVRCARIEIGWGSVNWNDETKINGASKFARLIEACQRWGIRPLILLNANQGTPCPTRFFDRTVTEDAPAGSRQVQLDDVSGLVLGQSDLNNLTGYWAAEALVVGIDGHTCKLSRPLPKEIKAGAKVPMATLKYRPFSVPGSDDWKQTIAGWQRYVGAVVALVARTLGTMSAADKGFDMEIWNEMSFGSNFIYVNHYYNPPFAQYDENSNWSHIVAATADEADVYPKAFSGVRFDDGFGNTLPWPASSKEPARIAAIGKHPYAGRRNLPDDRVKGKSISDNHDHYQFSGDGTPAHPPLYDRDVLAILPYQANARRFVIVYYVMTRDIKATLAPEDFLVTLAGLHGRGARVSAYDPIRDATVPVKVAEAGADSLTLRLTASDYPYLLEVQEAGR